MRKITFCLIFIIFFNLCYPCAIGSCIEFDNSVRGYEKTIFFSTPIIYVKEKFLELLLKDYIKKSTGVDSEINLILDNKSSDNTYIVNKLECTSPKPEYMGFQLTNLKLSTTDSGNIIVKDGNRLVIPNKVPMSFSASITNENFDYLTSSDEFKLLIGNMTAGFSNFIQIKDIQIQIADDKIRLQISGKLQVLFGMPVKVTLYPLLSAVDGKLYLNGIQSDKASAAYIGKILPSINEPQPLSNYIKVLKDADTYCYIDNFSVCNNEIYLDGRFIIPANCDITE